VYWFISLLFAFFVVFALIAPNPGKQSEPRTKGGTKVLAVLTGVTALTAAATFASLLFAPDRSWLTVGILLQFPATQLLTFVLYFAFGVSAARSGWLGHNALPAPLWAWIGITVALAMAYLAASQPLYATPETRALSPWLLLEVAVLRSAVTIAVLVTLLKAGAAFWNRPPRIARSFAGASYEVYLSHIWFVIPLAGSLVRWDAPSEAKAAVTLAAGVGLSYAFSMVMQRHPGVLAAIVAAVFGIAVVLI
jgi:hypothetical protein